MKLYRMFIECVPELFVVYYTVPCLFSLVILFYFLM